MRSLAQPFEKSRERSKEISFVYKNWRGETNVRTILPIKMWYGCTEWHPENQWFIKAIDLEKGEERDFAFSDIVSVE